MTAISGAAQASPRSPIGETDHDDEELELLALPQAGSHESVVGMIDHEIFTAPVFEREAYLACGLEPQTTQYGVLGTITSINYGSDMWYPNDPRLYLNTNSPFSSVISGVQGSGKSHTVAVMLEGMFIQECRQVGSLHYPLSGLVLHYGEGGKDAQPCEVASLAIATQSGIRPPRVCVYVPNSSLKAMRSLYANLGASVVVEPLMFEDHELDARAFLTLMAVGTDSDHTPLYIEVVLSILRELGEEFSYKSFHNKLKQRKTAFDEVQLRGLAQRLSLIEGFLARHQPREKRFSAGQITIVDLSDPFMDPVTACGIFDILVRQFQRVEVGTGKVLVVDEAHKYLGSSRGHASFSKTLVELTRQQRHLGMRIILSTQEPTVVPHALLDLCSIMVLHRFSSPSWYDHIKQHVAAHLHHTDALDKLLCLRAGEAVVIAPTGLKMSQLSNQGTEEQLVEVEQFGRSYMTVQTRRRATRDGGASVLVVKTQ